MGRALKTITDNSIDRILMQEAEMLNFGGTINTRTITTSTQNNLMTLAPNLGELYLAVNAKGAFSCDQDIRVFFSSNSENTSTISASLINIFIPKSGVVPFSFEKPFSNMPQMGVYGDAAATTPIPFKLGYTFSGLKVINDLNFNAEKRVYWLGDSITAGTANAIGVNNYYQFQVRNWLSKNSNSGTFRLTQKAFGGRTSVDFNTLLTYNYLFVDKPDIVFYQLGVNDQSQSVSINTFKSNLENIIDYKNTFWKDSILVFLGPTPTQQTARNTSLNAYRNAMSEVVIASGNSKVKYINLANSFDRTASPATIWAASDTPATNTDCIHPGTLISHTGIANTIIGELDAMNLVF
jgi:lysophospholipase L1-like esterase